MRLIFCVRDHTFDEIYMGHPMGFPAIHGVEAISATDNARGFTPLNAIAKTYGWQRKHLELALINRQASKPAAILTLLIGRQKRYMTGERIELLIEFGVILLAPIVHTYYLKKYKKVDDSVIWQNVKMFSPLYVLIACAVVLLLLR